MKDSQTNTIFDADNLSARIADAIEALARCMQSYADFVQPTQPSFAQNNTRLLLRHAPQTPELASVHRGHASTPDCGLSPQPGHLLLAVGRPMLSSNHAQMKAAALEGEVSLAVEYLAAQLQDVPLLAHDALQLEVKSYWSATPGEDAFALWVDGIQVAFGPRLSAQVARSVAERLSGAAWLNDWDTQSSWPFYQIQNHLIRAPGPGWAYIKLRMLLMQRPLSRDELSKILDGELPHVARVEPDNAIGEDLDRARFL